MQFLFFPFDEGAGGSEMVSRRVLIFCQCFIRVYDQIQFVSKCYLAQKACCTQSAFYGFALKTLYDLWLLYFLRYRITIYTRDLLSKLGFQRFTINIQDVLYVKQAGNQLCQTQASLS